MLILFLAIPAGYLIAWMAKDELSAGRKWFGLLVIAGLALALAFWILGYGYAAATCLFIAIVGFVSWFKSGGIGRARRNVK
jgi:cytochrome b